MHRILGLAALLAALVCGGAPAPADEGHVHGAAPAANPTAAAVPERAGAVASARRAAPARKGGARWGANYFPNIPLVSHEGREVRFFDDLIEGKVVVINFIFTSCRNSCPLETAWLAKVQRILGDRVGHDVFIYSISIDPEVDTPEVLRAYAEKFGIGPGWLFLTGNEAQITHLRRKLGMLIEEIQDEGNDDHNLSILIGNQSTGQWMQRSPFENPYFLAAQIGSWLHNWKLPDPSQPSYADAPSLRYPTVGEKLFRTRCQGCHTIGGRSIVGPGTVALGPDLQGVTRRRDRDWLVRWIADPEKMLADGDPIARELYAEYGQITMPNLYLKEAEVEAVLDFIREESRRVAEEARAAAGAD